MAMDPTPQNALDQHQSLLFRLPRELRDEIYYYYSQANGYYYDSTSGTLRMDGGECIDLSLQYTCKRTAAEMQGIALGINTMTFRTMLDLPRPSDQLMKSQIFGYYIDEGRGAILSRMLEWTYPLVTAETMRKLCERHPANLAVKKMRELHREGDSDGPLARGHLWGELEDVDTVDYNEFSAQTFEIIRDLLDITSTEPEFWHMTASDFDVNARRAFFVATNHWATRWEAFEDYLMKHVPVYTSKAEQQRVLQWRPDSWSIPTNDDLEAVAEFLPHDDDSDPFDMDIDQLMKEKDGDWPSDLEDVFEIRNLEQPPEGWCAAHEERFGVWEHRDYIEVDWTEYMEGVDMLFKQNEVSESD
ncbi:uncharacterized protein J4E79_001609 [Alternaria viburni]|uniref:uncharacterized protein n=1 Tax=Alternaria viburni TaxID=566460 RepID=UPI0020C2D994|nr:uncharacterized protein J4E79_001609 [Alternaria viburni]KAI4669564.1 hypothetical protein J4E79_001609 [Alternaria viburni]